MKEEEEAVTDFNIPTSFLPSSHLCGRSRSRSPGEISRKWRLLEEYCFIVWAGLRCLQCRHVVNVLCECFIKNCRLSPKL